MLEVGIKQGNFRLYVELPNDIQVLWLVFVIQQFTPLEQNEYCPQKGEYFCFDYCLEPQKKYLIFYSHFI
jgi:hypothetical protein